MKLFRKFLKSWYFEASLVVMAILGLAYVFNVSAAHEWGKQAINSFLSGFNQFLSGFNEILQAVNTPRILIAIVVIILVLALIAWRLLWRLQGSKKYSSTTCPRCEAPLVRVKSLGWQRKIRPIIPLRRFYCRNCGWKGLRVKGRDYTPLNLQPGKSTRVQVDKIS